MNQIKIGKFISQCRKEKKLTQNQLAEKLGITDKAVSKWETGKSMPDISLLIPLCEILDITLNEMFAGEYISEDKIKEKTDEVLINIMENRKRQNFISTLFSVMISIGIVLFFLPSINNWNMYSGIAVTAFGLLLFLIGVYGKIRNPRMFR